MEAWKNENMKTWRMETWRNGDMEIETWTLNT
jgi:hypothetical protein